MFVDVVRVDGGRLTDVVGGGAITLDCLEPSGNSKRALVTIAADA